MTFCNDGKTVSHNIHTKEFISQGTLRTANIIFVFDGLWIGGGGGELSHQLPHI